MSRPGVFAGFWVALWAVAGLGIVGGKALKGARVLLVATEGVTNPEGFAKVLA